MKYFSFFNVFTFIISAIVFAFIGVSLPPTINFVNGLSEGAFYGYLASYIVSMLLFWLFMRDYSLFSNKESSTMKFLKWYINGVKMALAKAKIRKIINRRYKQNSRRKRK